MKKIILMCALSVFLAQAGARANPPRDARLTAAGEAVTVIIDHPVSDPATHYVKLVRITQEGLAPVEKSLSTQEPAGVTLSIEIAGLRTDKPITVEAFCSRYGSISRTISPDTAS
ncbi:MAG TPA: hypothetical protein P5110_03740 [Candidatus Omnitrophota bacterium]|nr:hypothetical protein [Candidatus Omnitrophota bacterium]HRZ14604.1 hypothetical protein [Candidatus Omnitrophota bacterium]